MEPGEFERYMQGLAQIVAEDRQAPQLAAQCLESTKLIDKLIKQTAFCNGSSASAMLAGTFRQPTRSSKTIELMTVVNHTFAELQFNRKHIRDTEVYICTLHNHIMK